MLRKIMLVASRERRPRSNGMGASILSVVFAKMVADNRKDMDVPMFAVVFVVRTALGPFRGGIRFVIVKIYGIEVSVGAAHAVLTERIGLVVGLGGHRCKDLRLGVRPS